MKTTLAVYLVFYNFMFFETSIIFLQLAIKLSVGSLICKSKTLRKRHCSLMKNFSDLLENFSDIAILNICGVDYRCIY